MGKNNIVKSVIDALNQGVGLHFVSMPQNPIVADNPDFLVADGSRLFGIYVPKRIGKKYMPKLRRAEDWGLWMTILREVDYIYTYPKALWKYRHVPGSETSNKWKQLQAVITMYQEVLGFSPMKAKFIAWCWFLPNNIWKKLKKML